jgi:hypothetical protein
MRELSAGWGKNIGPFDRNEVERPCGMRLRSRGNEQNREVSRKRRGFIEDRKQQKLPGEIRLAKPTSEEAFPSFNADRFSSALDYFRPCSEMSKTPSITIKNAAVTS